MKKLKGFTLVELVVVIAIIGVLAAILIPSMLNYVRKARLRSANTNAKTAYNAVSEFVAEKQVEGIEKADAIRQYANAVIDCSTTPTGTQSSAQKAVFDVLSTNGITSGKVWVDSKTINNIDSFYVQWSGDADPTSAKSIFGQYPEPISWETWKEGTISWCSFAE